MGSIRMAGGKLGSRCHSPKSVGVPGQLAPCPALQGAGEGRKPAKKRAGWGGLQRPVGGWSCTNGPNGRGWGKQTPLMRLWHLPHPLLENGRHVDCRVNQTSQDFFQAAEVAPSGAIARLVIGPGAGTKSRTRSTRFFASFCPAPLHFVIRRTTNRSPRAKQACIPCAGLPCRAEPTDAFSSAVLVCRA